MFRQNSLKFKTFFNMTFQATISIKNRIKFLITNFKSFNTAILLISRLAPAPATTDPEILKHLHIIYRIQKSKT